MRSTPDINHPIEVAAILAGDDGVTDVPTLAAAVLRNTPEDTETTPGGLAREFGPGRPGPRPGGHR
jgi:GTP diphosphokinase / guanosine-3',5'-bis(diphosphate) 3'-diphosphatase